MRPGDKLSVGENTGDISHCIAAVVRCEHRQQTARVIVWASKGETKRSMRERERKGTRSRGGHFWFYLLRCTARQDFLVPKLPLKQKEFSITGFYVFLWRSRRKIRDSLQMLLAIDELLLGIYLNIYCYRLENPTQKMSVFQLKMLERFKIMPAHVLIHLQRDIFLKDKLKIARR